MLAITTIGGLLISLLALAAALFLEGGGAGGLFSLSALIIVAGGTLGATVMSHGFHELRRLPGVLLLAFGKGTPHQKEVARQLLEFGEIVRRQGVLALEEQLEQVTDPFLRQTIALLVDGTDSKEIEAFLRTDTQLYKDQVTRSARVFQTAGGYAPTMGIIGTVMGLVHVLGSLSEPDKLGGAIATAFLATFYGVASANLLWLPLGNKIQAVADEILLYRRMVTEAVLAIQRGEPRLRLEERLRLYVGELPAESAEQETPAAASEAAGDELPAVGRNATRVHEA